MKRFISAIISAAMLTTGINIVYAEVPSLNYGSFEMENMRDMIDRCAEKGFNTDYEMLNYTVLNKFITYTAEDIERGVDESRITYNTNYLNGLYEETLDTLNAYLDGTKKPKSKGYVYETGDYNIAGSDIVTADGTPFFSSGFGHDSEAADELSVFPNFGMNNIQTEM